MAEYIDREVAIKLVAEDRVEITPMHLAIGNAVGGYTIEQVFDSINQACDRHIEFIKSVPSADIRPVKHGKWDVVEVEDVSTKSSLPITTIASMWCSQCNRFHNEIYYYGDPTEYANYCPHCGAKMDGEKNG